MIYRCILAEHAREESPSLPKVEEGEFSDEKLKDLNSAGYNIYYLPNYPSTYNPSVPVDGSHIDTFRFVFADLDLKHGAYKNEEEFKEKVLKEGPEPTYVVHSGHGVHVYWQVSDLDALNFLKLQRRICRKFNTDDAVSKIYQLMRTPNTVNTKVKGQFKLCEEVYSSDKVYTCEQLDTLLPPISQKDEDYCKQHYDKTYNLTAPIAVDDKIPLKFAELIRRNQEVKDIWSCLVDDRSKGDYRLGHIMLAHDFTKEEALSVLVNSAKALSRAPVHRISYATGIVDKIWAYEQGLPSSELSSSVADILEASGEALEGTRFRCWKWVDDTEAGFRLGHIIGLVAGVGVGKTAVALNMFMGFVQNNPEYDHFFIPLEQPKEEIAARWRTMCQGNTSLHSKVQVLSNYDKDGGYRNLSLEEIKQYILQYKKRTGRKVGAVVIDHIGVLKKKTKDGENQGIMDICHEMKAFAMAINCMLIMQSQAPREKAGIGDLELDKDAAYGTVFFEAYCDYLITVWQPLKRCYKEEGCPTVTAYKFCKIRHKMQGSDVILEDNPYMVFYDPATQRMQELTQDMEQNITFWVNKATNARKRDRKTDLVTYTTIRWDEGTTDGGAVKDNQDTGGTEDTQRVGTG